MISFINKLTRYNDWANQKIFEQFSQEEGKVPPGCMHLLCHIVNTQTVWLSRIQGQLSPVRPWEDHSLEVCKEMHMEANEVLRHFSAADIDPEQVIAYQTFQGTPYENTIYDILIHLFNHGTYHRAQIAQDMRKNGLEPVNTDYIAFVR